MSDYLKNPIVLFAHYWECSPSWSWNPKNNNWEGYELWLVTGGEGAVYLRNEEKPAYLLKPGSCLAFRMDKDYFVTHKSDNPLTVYGIHFMLNGVSEKLKEFRQFENYELLKNLMKRTIYFHKRNRVDEEKIYFETALREFVARDEVDSQDELYGTYPLNQLAIEIQRNPGVHYTLAEMAQLVNKSPNSVIRMVRKETNLTPMEMQNRIKIDLAKQYLHATNASLEKIAELLGFSDRYYFSRVFKGLTGIPPGQYRRSPPEESLWGSGRKG